MIALPVAAACIIEGCAFGSQHGKVRYIGHGDAQRVGIEEFPLCCPTRAEGLGDEQTSLGLSPYLCS